MRENSVTIELIPRVMPEPPFGLKGKRGKDGSIRYAYSAVLYGVVPLGLAAAAAIVLIELQRAAFGPPPPGWVFLVLLATSAILSLLAAYFFAILHEVTLHPDGSATYRHRRLLGTTRVHAPPGSAQLEYCDVMIAAPIIPAFLRQLTQPFNSGNALISVRGTGVAVHASGFTAILSVRDTDGEAAEDFAVYRSDCEFPTTDRVIRLIGGSRITRKLLARSAPLGDIWKIQ